MACEDQITSQDLENAKDDATFLGEISTSRQGAVSTGGSITESINRFGEVTDTILGRLNKLGVIYSDPIKNWTPSLLVNQLEAHRYPADTGDIYIPVAPLPFTTSATFDTSKWIIWRGEGGEGSVDNPVWMFESIEAVIASTDEDKIYDGAAVNVEIDGSIWDVKPTTEISPDDLTRYYCVGVPTMGIVKRANTKYDGGFEYPSAQKTTYAEPLSRVISGEQYLWAFHKRLADAPLDQIQILFSGDSTTQGTNANGFFPSEVCRRYAQAMGVGNPQMVNRGFGGDSVLDWESTHLANDLNGYPDMALYVWRWGINDPFYGNTAEEVFAAMESGFTTFRAQLPTEDCAIILMMPNSTYSPADGRDQTWFEQLTLAYKQIAVKYQCCFIDTYSLFRDSYTGAGLWLDAVGESGSVGRVHPDEHFNMVICKVIADIAFGPIRGMSLDTNRLQNNHPDFGTVTISTTPSNYGYGKAMWSTDNTFPFEGVVNVDKWADDSSIQTALSNGDLGTQQVVSRVSKPGLNLYSNWFDLDYNIEAYLANGWTKVSGNNRPCHIRRSPSGLIHLHALLEGGSTTTNAAIFNLPAFFYAKHNLFGVAVSANNEFGTVIVSASTGGQIRVGSLPSNVNVSINIFWNAESCVELTM